MGVKPGYELTEAGVFPKEWEIEPLGKHATFRTGPFGSALHKSDYSNDGIPIVNPMHIVDGKIEPSRTMTITEQAARGLSDFRMKPGDIVIGRRGDMGRCSVVLQHQSGWLCGTGSMIVRPQGVDPGFLQRVLSSPRAIAAIEDSSVGTTMVNLNQGTLAGLRVQFPPLPEQRAIAAALNDVDALLDRLDRLIAKKRDLKQAAMQQLLTGLIRLPGFHGEWKVKRLGDCLCSPPDYGINAEAVPYSDRLPSYIRITDISEHGRFCPDPRVSVKAARADQYYLRKGDVVFARTGASVGKCYLYSPCDGELVFAGFLIRVRPNPKLLISAYLAAHAKTKPYWNWVHLMSMRSGQPGINGNEYSQLPISLPSLAEQTAIVVVLSDMDAEVSALETRREKTRALKQGMMQELLTGQTRLIACSTESKIIALPHLTPTQPEPKKPSHNWAFNEAVVISVLADEFGSTEFPLGRMRCTKLAYLLHRHTDREVKGYLKKAAGPYNPATRYAGPEGIAQENCYIKRHKRDQYEGFIAAENIAQARGYFLSWYGQAALDWLEHFRHWKNERLELVATVDMAADELERAGKQVRLEAIKSVIRNHPEWEAKLDRPAFNDERIAVAIDECQRLFST